MLSLVLFLGCIFLPTETENVYYFFGKSSETLHPTKSYSISQHRMNSLLYSISLHCLVPFFFSDFAHLDGHLNSILFTSPHIDALHSISLHCCWNYISCFSLSFCVFYITSPKVKSYSNYFAAIGDPFISPHCCCNHIPFYRRR